MIGVLIALVLLAVGLTLQQPVQVAGWVAQLIG